VVSELGTHLSVARARAGVVAGVPVDPAAPSRRIAAVEAALAAIPDPELPVLSIVDLGIVHRVEATDDAVRVEILPTFIGCPALDVIRDDMRRALAGFGDVEVVTTFAVPWTSERISATGRAALASAGIAPPGAPEAMRCPHCASDRVVMDSAFGPTQCRMLYYCRDCRQPFEALKSV
jgi:ring-1,2-phenylacetyl-CoA epoxidase subunit PaaD